MGPVKPPTAEELEAARRDCEEEMQRNNLIHIGSIPGPSSIKKLLHYCNLVNQLLNSVKWVAAQPSTVTHEIPDDK